MVFVAEKAAWLPNVRIASGELRELHLCGRILEGIVDQIDVALPGGSGETAMAHPLQRTGLKRDALGNKGHAYAQEIFHGAFQRAFRLPIQIDADQAGASFEQGILTLRSSGRGAVW